MKNLCIFAVSRAENVLCGMGGRGARHNKGVYYALVLTVRNFANFQSWSKTKQRECPSWVCYTHSPIVH